MKIINLIGNGESRLNFDIVSLNDYKIGCNAVFRDYNIDCLVAVDRRIVQEALDSQFNKDIYTRSDWNSSFPFAANVRFLPPLPYNGDLREDNPWNWGTGTHAANLAATLKPKEIHLWGFDLWSKDQKINNIYKGTRNYDPITHNSIDPKFWIYQLYKCFEKYPDIIWVQHQTLDWVRPEAWIQKNLVVNRT